MSTPHTALAARILTEILQRPDHHDQSSYLDGIEVLHPEDDLTAPANCRTTLCVAAYATHFTGHTVLRSGYTYLPGVTRPTRIEVTARRALGLNETDAEWLFHPKRTRGAVLAALGQLAQGADSIDTYAITAHGA